MTLIVPTFNLNLERIPSLSTMSRVEATQPLILDMSWTFGLSEAVVNRWWETAGQGKFITRTTPATPPNNGGPSS